jgi:hypothetical protein
MFVVSKLQIRTSSGRSGMDLRPIRELVPASPRGRPFMAHRTGMTPRHHMSLLTELLRFLIGRVL